MLLTDAFSTITDFRRAQGKRYQLSSVLILCVMGIMSGFNAFRELGEFAQSNYRADRIQRSDLFNDYQKRHALLEQSTGAEKRVGRKINRVAERSA